MRIFLRKILQSGGYDPVKNEEEQDLYQTGNSFKLRFIAKIFVIEKVGNLFALRPLDVVKVELPD